MNTFRKLLSGFIALSMLAACSDDISRVEEENTHPYHEGDDFFMGLDIQLPGGIYSRSQTITGGGSNGGEEIKSKQICIYHFIQNSTPNGSKAST